MTLDTLPEDLRQLVKQELSEDEKVGWVGQPDPVAYARRSCGGTVIGFMMTGFSLLWIAAAAGFKVPNFQRGADFFALLGFPFLLMGILFLFSPVLLRKKAENIVYAITNRRIFLLERGANLTVQSLQPSQLHHLTCKERPNGSGHIIFDVVDPNQKSTKGPTEYLAFIAIPDVRTVEKIVIALAETELPLDDSPSG